MQEKIFEIIPRGRETPLTIIFGRERNRRLHAAVAELTGSVEFHDEARIFVAHIASQADRLYILADWRFTKAGSSDINKNLRPTGLEVSRRETRPCADEARDRHQSPSLEILSTDKLFFG